MFQIRWRLKVVSGIERHEEAFASLEEIFASIPTHFAHSLPKRVLNVYDLCISVAIYAWKTHFEGKLMIILTVE